MAVMPEYYFPLEVLTLWLKCGTRWWLQVHCVYLIPECTVLVEWLLFLEIRALFLPNHLFY